MLYEQALERNEGMNYGDTYEKRIPGRTAVTKPRGQYMFGVFQE